ncbi:Hypothetical predicted protein [Mytilus galloprovincialis]|uniref:Uncharacterized protein n=2 Tax=Mytilus galloprovincialis TaxID=29158 RepID=A0A8B6CIN4_MYTGA|nr:Hypothetical predicted protein [Mytilus galloprovincialis]
MVSKVLMVSFILMLIALLVYVIGFSTPHFVDIELPPYKIYGGLWVRCQSLHDVKDCMDTADFTGTLGNLGNRGWFKTCKATSILGFIFLFMAIVCAGLKLCDFLGRTYIIASTCMTIAAVVFILVAVIVFTQNVEEVTFNLPYKYGFSFALIIVGMCIAVIAGVIMVVECFMGVHE